MTAVFILTGFLGAGKTSLLQHMLEGDVPAGTVVLVNEFGQLGLDGRLLEQGGLSLYELNSGCICCTLNDELGKTLTRIVEQCAPQCILIEASGVADPANIRDTVARFPHLLKLTQIIAVLDARLWNRRAVLGALFLAQLSHADLLVLNKTDLVSKEQLTHILAEVKRLFPKVTLCLAQHGRIDADLFWTPPSPPPNADRSNCLGRTRLLPYQLVAAQPSTTLAGSTDTASGFTCLSFSTEHTLSRNALQAFLATPPPQLFRVKGQVVFEDETLYLDVVDGQIVWSQPPAGLAGTCLVFIGQGLDTKALHGRLQTLFATAPDALADLAKKHTPDLTHRQILQRILEAGLAAVAPDQALLSHMHLKGDTLWVDDAHYDLAGRRVFVLGAGKGAAPMAAALEHLLGTRITKGQVVVKYGHGIPLKHIALAEAAHPVPDKAGEKATRALLKLARETRAGDLVICLITGGASALTPAPVAGVTLEDIQICTSLLLECGATIQQINAVRKHLSSWGGGQLARVLAPAQVCTLLISDVVGDDLSVIASGPTVPDSSTFAQCLNVIAGFSLLEKMPAAIINHLRIGARGDVPENPKPDNVLFHRVRNILVATNSQALRAAASEAQNLGYESRILPENMTGEARECARELVRQAKEQVKKQNKKGVCLLAGGETTVTIHGNGTGGRNQEMALAAALALENEERVVALFAGTDGTDGPTEAAGGFADSTCASNMRRAGIDPAAFLAANNSHEALRLADALLVTGPTRTNVMDIAIVLIRPKP